MAAKAGVAKGTIYLYFDDKHHLFEEIVRSAMMPVLTRLEHAAAIPDVPVDAVFGRLFDAFRREVLGTDRALALRLVLTEGARFPKIASFYHREVVSKGLALIGLVVQRGQERGEMAARGLERFPHLISAPCLLTLLWDGLFAKFERPDVEDLLLTYRKLLANADNQRSG